MTLRVLWPLVLGTTTVLAVAEGHLIHLSRSHCVINGHRYSASTRVRANADTTPESNPAQQVKNVEPLSPQNAIAELGPLLEQVKLVWTEGSTWSPAEREQRRRDIIEKYVRVFAPALSFSAAQLGLSIGVFLTVLIALNVSGRGFTDLSAAFTNLPLFGDLLEKVDPSWGNAAIALVVVEVMAPLLLPVALALTPGMTASLQSQLEAWGLDAEGLNARIEKVLKDTTD